MDLKAQEMPKTCRVSVPGKPLFSGKLNAAGALADLRVNCRIVGSSTFCHPTRFASSTKGFASPFSVDRPTDALIPPVLLFFMTSTSAITSKTLNSCGRIQTVCQTFVIKWDQDRRAANQDSRTCFF
jgi:hypothetical protein